MKKLLAILLVAVMVFALAACGDNNTTDPDNDNPGTSQSDDGILNREEDKGELWNVADADITILNEGHDVAIVPAGLKKGIGTQSKAQIYLRDPSSTFASIYKSLYEANYKEVA